MSAKGIAFHTRSSRPLHDWCRHHPAAKEIAGMLREHAPMLSLPRWMVLADVRARFKVGDCTARVAYALAKSDRWGPQG